MARDNRRFIIDREDKVAGVRFTDSDRLIFCCYSPGAGGFALRVMLQFSQGVERNFAEYTVRADGAAHIMTSRHGLKMDKHASSGFDLLAVPSDLGLTHTLAFWDRYLDDRLIPYCRDVIDSLWTWRGVPAAAWQKLQRMIWVDHIPPHVARMLFPQSKIVYLRRDWKACSRDYVIKNLLQHPNHDPLRYDELISLDMNDHVLDLRIREAGAPKDRFTYKDFMRRSIKWQIDVDKFLEDEHHSHDVLMIDANEIFNLDTYRPQYDALMQHCGLEPNYTRCEMFIGDYQSKQYLRGKSILTDIPTQ